MPEALAVLAVFAVVVIAWVGASLQARDPAQQNASADLQRLQQHAAWLQHRLSVARRENWGDDMIASLGAELDATTQQLARTTARITVR